jgi:acyl-coenzyme A thioesterase PaaI-like protein
MTDVIIRKLYNAKHCYVCGTHQQEGLHAFFYVLESNRLLTVYEPKEAHFGYPGMLHGGVMSALLDEGMARAYQITHDEPFGVTMKLDVKYLKKVQTTKTLYVVAKVIKDTSKIFYTEGYLTDGIDIYAKADASYIKMHMEDVHIHMPYEMVIDQTPRKTVELPL